MAASKTTRAVRWLRKYKILYFVIGAAAVAGALAFQHATPTPAAGTGFWSMLFGNGWVIAVARVAIIAAGCYVVYSVIHTVSRGVPLKELAGAKVADRVSDKLIALRQTHATSEGRHLTMTDELRDLLAASEQLMAENARVLATVTSEAPRSDQRFHETYESAQRHLRRLSRAWR